MADDQLSVWSRAYWYGFFLFLQEGRRPMQVCGCLYELSKILLTKAPNPESYSEMSYRYYFSKESQPDTFQGSRFFKASQGTQRQFNKKSWVSRGIQISSAADVWTGWAEPSRGQKIPFSGNTFRRSFPSNRDSEMPAGQAVMPPVKWLRPRLGTAETSSIKPGNGKAAGSPGVANHFGVGLERHMDRMAVTY